MEIIDKKGGESLNCVMSSSKDGSGSSLKLSPVKADINVEGKGGSNGNDERNEEEKGNEEREESVKSPLNPDKHVELGSGKQTTKPVEVVSKKTAREEKYSRRKDERSVEQLMRSLNSFESPQEKLDALVKKYADMADENRKLQTQTKNIERRLTQVEREKDSAQSEHSKAVLARSRLEGLCRELQRQNRAIKEESVLKIREEEEKRKEVSNKFQSTLAEITSLMQQNNEKNSKLRDDNIEMTTKFKSVCEQYELRVQQVEKISKQMQLEAQLADAKLAKAQLEAKAERETLLRDKHELLMELAQNQARAKEQQETEIRLREQVDLYTKKYDEFQSALSRSNEVFGGFKEEMDRMSKKIVKLEKETSTWKQRWEKSHQALLEMATDKQQRDAELSLTNRQLNQLHKLCRTLTEERAKLMAQINALEAPSDAVKDETKEAKLAADIADDRRKLNDTLDSLQSVIKERELLHKQQQLEKQQHHLHVELQKHIAASVTEQQKGKQSNRKASEEKTPDFKESLSREDTKVNGNKVNEAGKKKGKKQKSGRPSVEKQSSSEESKLEGKDTSSPPPEMTDAKSSVEVPATQVASFPTSSSPTKVSDPGEKAGNQDPAETSNPASVIDTVPSRSVSMAAAASSEPSLVAEAISSQSTSFLDLVVPELPAVGPDTVTPNDPITNPITLASSVIPMVSESKVMTKTSSQPLPELLSESSSAPAAFSYAAAVGSKPAEQLSVVDQCHNEKTEPKFFASENGTTASVVTNKTIRSAETTDVMVKSDVSEAPVSKSEEVVQATSTPVSSIKKGKVT